MTEPVSLTAVTPRHSLRYLFSGQSQKEFIVNESLARIDMLLQAVVENEKPDPPATPIPGQCWIVAPRGTADWAGKDGAIAGWDGAQWIFSEPVAGMRVHDRHAGGQRRYSGVWDAISQPTAPTGGEVIDAEARAAVVAILSALQQYGIFSEP